MPQATATILGAGSIGTALSILLAENKYKVTLWDQDQDVIDSINRFHKNPRSLTEVVLDKSIKAEHDIEKSVYNSDMVVICVPSNAVRDVSSKIAGSLARNCVIVSVAKGLEEGTFKPMFQVIREQLGGDFEHHINVVSGPMLAHEIAKKSSTSAMMASKRANAFSKRAIDAFTSEWFKVCETRDVVGVSVAGATKNALAVASGIISGLGLSSNTYAWVITEGFREMARLTWKIGGQEDTVYGIAGFGDMIATCFSASSRNREFGELVGKGKTVTRAQQTVGETVEGIGAIDTLYKIALKEKLNLPILKALYEIVSLKKKAEKVFDELIRNF
jgi:glycerol-3-phosphate dehydrogenase (NAD(P)+)